ncbi:PPC domain-containing DNA-binding protein [Gemmata sp.]|uniref:PPC domain-containing DNA-binding protein n=1 Tax=Gemmata sp. TaxID=1914242 RepID=UPI003F71D38F
MQSKLIQERAGERTWVLVFGTGEEVMAGLGEFARNADLTGSHFTAIGAFSDVVLGFFDPNDKRYAETPIREQVEVLSLLGKVARHQGGPKVHAHVVVGKRDGTAHGGHMMEARVRPTLEVVVVESPGRLGRRTDDRTGLPLLKLD